MEAQTSCEATILNMKPHGRKPLAWANYFMEDKI
jgi:hypothetical protein